MKRVLPYILLLGVLIGTFALITARGRSRVEIRNGTATIIVDSLPATVDIFGGKLTLESTVFRKRDSQLWLYCSFRDPGMNPKSRNAYYIEVANPRYSSDRSSKVEVMGGSWLRPVARRSLRFAMICHCTEMPRYLTVDVTLIKRRHSKFAQFDFKSVKSSELPVTRRFGEARTTLAYFGRSKVKLKGYYSVDYGLEDGKPCFLVHLRSVLPKGFRHDAHHDGSGLKLAGVQPEIGQYSSDAPESAIGCVTKNPQEMGVPNTIHKWPANAVVVNDWFMYAPINPSPKVISFAASGCVPPERNDVVRLRLSQIPVRSDM